MREAGRWALEREWSERELEEAKLSVFQAVDAPVSVNEEGATLFLSGIDAEIEQRRREWLLDCSVQQVREAAEKVEKGVRDANVVLLGERKGFVKENQGWRVEQMGIAVPGQEGVDVAAAAAGGADAA